jgi:hypothetical protein
MQSHERRGPIAGLVIAASSRQFAPGFVFIAMGSAAALLAIELVYVCERVISPICRAAYLI